MASSKRLVIELVVLILVFAVGLSTAGSSGSDPSQDIGSSPSLDALKRGFVATEEGDGGHGHQARRASANEVARVQTFDAVWVAP